MAVATALSAQRADAALLPPLREEIGIFPGPSALDGSPTWTLHDPSRNRFYRLGWREFEILSRWSDRSADHIAARIAAETTLDVEPGDVAAFANFLTAYDLLHQSGPQTTARFLEKAARERESWGAWLLHNYLFMRIPLVRPDRLLNVLYPRVAWLFSRSTAYAVIAITLLGFYLCAREWDVFRATFVDLLNVQGAIQFAITLVCLKVIHELGHALTAKRFGCRVPTMGIALLVLVPVPFTDVNDAWKLTQRRQRLAIGLAGVTAELACAGVAACAWSFLPNGPARTAAFLVATTTWVTTLLINLSPFMRFDGYYVLSDLIEMPNLHGRAFALARWWLRTTCLGLTDPPPEEFPASRRRILIAFAFATWIYRVILFLGIAVLVYHFAFKLAGIAMAAVEIGYFLAWPVIREMRQWWRRRGDVRWNRNTVAAAGAVALLVLALVVPWRASIEAPALLRSAQHVGVFVPEFGAKVESVNVRDGGAVVPGAVLIRLVSPDIDYQVARARREIATLEWQVEAGGVDRGLLARSRVTEQELEAALAEYRAYLGQRARLSVMAPIAGRAVDLDSSVVPGAWLPPRLRVMSIIDPNAVEVEAYIGEADLLRIAVGDRAIFFAEADPGYELPLKVGEIARASTRVLEAEALASVFGGPIAVRQEKPREFHPDQTIYRVTLRPDGDNPVPERVLRGNVIFNAKPVSLIARIWRSVAAVVIRESGL